MTVFKIRKQKVVADMATTFTNEGYVMQFKTESLALMFYKLKHRSNKNEIIVIGRPLHNYFEVKKNGKVIKYGAITERHPEEVHQH